MTGRLRVYIVAEYEPLRAGLAIAIARCPDLERRAELVRFALAKGLAPLQKE